MGTVTTEALVEMLLDRIQHECVPGHNSVDAIDPRPVKIDGENVIGIEDPETGAMWFVEVKEA